MHVRLEFAIAKSYEVIMYESELNGATIYMYIYVGMKKGEGDIIVLHVCRSSNSPRQQEDCGIPNCKLSVHVLRLKSMNSTHLSTDIVELGQLPRVTDVEYWSPEAKHRVRDYHTNNKLSPEKNRLESWFYA